MLPRRAFLRNSALTAIGFGLGGRSLVAEALGATRAAGAADPVLVAVNLQGGNDLLNTVVPLRAYGRYRDLRPSLAIPEHRLLPIAGTPDFALNPGLGAIRELYDEGKVAIVNGVGLPRTASGLFDHEASQINFQAAHTVGSATPQKPTGWLGRYVDTLPGGQITPGVNVYGGNVILQGAVRDPLVVNALWDLAVNATFDWEPTMRAYQAILNKPRLASPAAEQMRLERKTAFDQAAVVRRATDRYEPAVEYPDAACDDAAKPCNWFAHQLLDCAKLIVAGLGVRVLALSSFGYDTHAGQNDGEFHDYLLAGVADAIGAFVRDLRAHRVADRVVILVFTEFGRRPEENADGGTDHGFGGGMFVIGDAVRGGVYGDFPSLEPGRLVLDGNLDVTVDFRSVYATILERHLGADSQPILGGSFPTLDFL